MTDTVMILDYSLPIIKIMNDRGVITCLDQSVKNNY